MFKKFTKDDISTKTLTKNSISKAYRAAIIKQIPGIEPYLESLLPSKTQITTIKCLDNHILLIPDINGKEILFFSERGEVWFPTLRLLHQYPNILPRLQVDKGAIKFSYLCRRERTCCMCGKNNSLYR